MAPATDFGIIGIDQQRTLAFDGGAGEAGENEHAGIVRILRGDIFLGDEIHSVAQAASPGRPAPCDKVPASTERL